MLSTYHVMGMVLGFGGGSRMDFARIAPFRRPTTHHSAAHSRQSSSADAYTCRPAGCARRTAPWTRHASSSAGHVTLLIRGKRSEDARLPSATSIAQSPPAAIPVRRRGATAPAAKGRQRTSAGGAPHARPARSNIAQSTHHPRKSPSHRPARAPHTCSGRSRDPAPPAAPARRPATAISAVFYRRRPRNARARAPALALCAGAMLTVEGARPGGSSREQRRPPAGQSRTCRCGCG